MKMYSNVCKCPKLLLQMYRYYVHFVPFVQNISRHLINVIVNYFIYNVRFVSTLVKSLATLLPADQRGTMIYQDDHDRANTSCIHLTFCRMNIQISSNSEQFMYAKNLSIFCSAMWACLLQLVLVFKLFTRIGCEYTQNLRHWLCNWLSLWCLVPWLNPLPPVCWSIFWNLVLNNNWPVSRTNGKRFFCIDFDSDCIFVYIS